jgi:hypothetical protein
MSDTCQRHALQRTDISWWVTSESEQREPSNVWKPCDDLTQRKSSKIVNQGPPSFFHNRKGLGVALVLGTVGRKGDCSKIPITRGDI